MAAPAVKVSVRIDQKALARELKSSNGSTGRTIAAFAGLLTREVNEVFIERAGGPWWRVKSTIFDGGRYGASATVNVRPSRPHVIRAKNAAVLTFKFPDGQYFSGVAVRHPGSSVPEALVQLGVDNALKRKDYKFLVPRQ